jgi:hypothetical protein
MDREALIKLLGEQTLCQSEYQELLGQFNRDKMALSELSSTMHNAGAVEWFAGGGQLLERIHTTKVKMDALTVRIAELKNLTGR